MPTPEELQQQIDRMTAQLETLKKQQEELSKPLEVYLHNVIFHGMGATFEIKFNRPPEPEVLNRIRYIPSRNYIHTREVNAFDIRYFDKLNYELKEANLDLVIPDDLGNKIKQWKEAPDFTLSLDEKKKQIRVDRTIKRTMLPSIYELGSWTYHSTDSYWTFNISELLKWMELQVTSFNMYKFDMTEDVKKLYIEQEERDKLVNAFADMKDAPDIDFKFEWSNGEAHNFDLKADQRVACKFDDTFSHRTLLSFDMGKGKTAISIAQAERHNERVLFVCKADLKTNIKREVKKFTGKEAHIFSGIEPDRLDVEYMLVKKPQYCIINYDIIGRETGPDEAKIMKWVELINIAKFDRIIYDEAHYMKNMDTLRSRGGRALKAEKVMLLTGTPIVNKPGEIFPILNIIDPITFSDYPSFVRQFTYDGKNPKNLPQLHALLKRYMIRRLRDKTLDPQRIPQYHELSALARKRYSEVMNGLYTALRNPKYQANVNNILTELLRCKQICADDKVDFTVDLVETALEETVELPWNKVLVFSQFKNTQAEIAARLGHVGARIINGDVTDRARYDLIDLFQSPDQRCRVLVTNITEGITLTQAGTTIINDLWWTPKDHVQAEGRAFGRENDPHGGNAYYILAENTIDEMIWKLLEKKMMIAKQIVDDVYVSKDDESNSLLSDLFKMIKEGK